MLLQDHSIAHRLIGILAGILIIFNEPFGGGAGSYSYIISSMLQYHDTIFSHLNSSGTGAVSSFGFYAVEYGIFFYLLIFFVF